MNLLKLVSLISNYDDDYLLFVIELRIILDTFEYEFFTILFYDNYFVIYNFSIL